MNWKTLGRRHMKINIEDVAEEKGRSIAKKNVEKYGINTTIKHKSFFASFTDGIFNGGLSRLKVEKEIYERLLHEATFFFLNNGDEKFDNRIIEILQCR